LAVLPLGAATIDVSTTTTALLHPGDSLRFDFLSWNFSIHALSFGLPAYPTQVGFLFVTAPTDSAAQFDATLESKDGSVSVPLGVPLSFVPGVFRGSLYRGPVATLQGWFHLPETLSQELFGGSAAVLTLRDIGADVTVGLPPYRLRQDLTVSLSGGPLSVGAVSGGVTLEQEADPPPQVPEPHSGTLLLGGLALLGLLSAARNQISRRNIP
jgi:hypothetical protein